MTFDTYLENISNPSAQHRPWPLFVLNEDYDDAAGLQRLHQGLEDAKRAGFGGVFIHPRPGLTTEYLSPRWFEVVESLVHKCLELGLVPGLYDENSYPSGCAGGHVCSRRPEARAIYVEPCQGSGPKVPAGMLALYAATDGQPGERISAPQGDDAWIAFVQQEAKVLAWHGHVPVPNLLDPLTAQTFLETTHDAYRANLSAEAFAAIPAMFTDEPHLVTDSHGPLGKGLPITPYVAARFRMEFDYDLHAHLAELFFDVGDYQAVRYDYYDFCHRLWVESWAKPLHAWHQQHGWQLTGHYLEHDWPIPYATPGQMEMLVHMDWPGTDLLMGYPLEGHDSFELQNFEPSQAGREPHLLFILRQAMSVANQFEKERVMNECWGAGGHDSTPRDWLRMGRYLVVHGVNLLVPHHAMSSIRGTRKHDHPQFFSAQSPWHAYLPQLNDELSRLCAATTEGRVENRILVLDAQTTAFCQARKSDCKDMPWSEFFGAKGAISKQENLHALRHQTTECVQALSDAQYDFDIGDEYIIGHYGEATAEGCLRIGAQSYECIVWPAGLSNLRRETCQQLEAFLSKGGRLVGVRPEAGFTVNGRPSDLLEQWTQSFPDRLKWTSPDELTEAIGQWITPRAKVIGDTLGLSHQRRVTEFGTLWLWVNSSSESRRIEIPDTSHYMTIDLITGESCRLTAGEIDIPADSARLIIETSQAIPDIADAAQPVATVPSTTTKPLLPESIQPTETNVCVLDRCTLHLNHETLGPIECRAANAKVFEAHAMLTTAMSGTIQYRRQLLDRAATLPKTSGYTVRYSFELSADFDPQSLQLAVEVPELWTVQLNGSPLDYSSADTWLDPNIRALNIASLVKAGSNTVEIQQSPFDPRSEISAVYLLGDFTLAPTNSGFRIEPSTALQLGAWSKQGRPFYERRVDYHFVAPGDGQLYLSAKDWNGSWLLAESATQKLQIAEGSDLCITLHSGEAITLAIVGLPQNLLGPWHVAAPYDRQQKFTAGIHWEAPFAEVDQRHGQDYHFLELGLLRAPTFRNN